MKTRRKRRREPVYYVMYPRELVVLKQVFEAVARKSAKRGVIK